jgi:hypothetical protein
MVVVEILFVDIARIIVILTVTGFKAVSHPLQLLRISRSSILFLEGIVGIGSGRYGRLCGVVFRVCGSRYRASSSSRGWKYVDICCRASDIGTPVVVVDGIFLVEVELEELVVSRASEVLISARQEREGLA